jgi:flagellar biosynthesis protein FlhB
MDTLTNFTRFLQACITPVALISGVGLLLLTMTNRIGRVVDRIRHLVAELDHPDVKRDKIKADEIKILSKRGDILKNSIAWMLAGMISSCLIIPLLFIMSFLGTNLVIVGHLLFIISILSLFVSLIYFFRDVLMSLSAIKLEAKEYIG